MAPSSLKKMSGSRGWKEGNYASANKPPLIGLTNGDLGLTLLPGLQIQKADEHQAGQDHSDEDESRKVARSALESTGRPIDGETEKPQEDVTEKEDSLLSESPYQRHARYQASRLNITATQLRTLARCSNVQNERSEQIRKRKRSWTRHFPTMSRPHRSRERQLSSGDSVVSAHVSRRKKQSFDKASHATIAKNIHKTAKNLLQAYSTNMYPMLDNTMRVYQPSNYMTTLDFTSTAINNWDTYPTMDYTVPTYQPPTGITMPMSAGIATNSWDNYPVVESIMPTYQPSTGMTGEMLAPIVIPDDESEEIGDPGQMLGANEETLDEWADRFFGCNEYLEEGE